MVDRLVEQGVVRRERRRVLGILPTTRLPAVDTGHEADLRARITRVLQEGEQPDTHTAAVIALVSASGTLPSLHPNPRWTTPVITRAKELEQGQWGAAAVGTVRIAAALAASTTAVVVTTVT